MCQPPRGGKERRPVTFEQTRCEDSAILAIHNGLEIKLFHLERTEDASGVSGIGKVAEGVVFDDGTVVLRWLTEIKSTVFFESIKDVESVHGHEGKTRIIYE